MSDDEPTPPDEPPPPEDQVPPLLGRPREAGRLRRHLIDLTPLRSSREFRLLWFGQAVSWLGGEFSAVAIPFQVFKATGSVVATGLIAAAELIPLFLFSLIGGSIADAVDRRKLLLWVHVGLVGTTVLLALSAAVAPRTVWPLYALAAAQAAGYALFLPALRSLIPRLVPREQLPAANALESAYGTFGFLAGPILGGIVIDRFGLATAYLVDGVTFLWALALLWRLSPQPPSKDATRAGLRSIVEGVRFLKGKPVLQSVFTIDLNAMIFGMPTSLFPAIAARLGGGARTLGILRAAPYLGSFLVSMFSGGASRVRRQGRAIMIAATVWGAAIVAFGFARSLWVAVACLAVAGAGDMVSGIFRSTIPQTVVPDHLRGRLSGIELSVVATGPTLGDLEAGLVGGLVGLQFSIVSGGILCILGVAAHALFRPEFGRYDAKHPTP